MKLRVLLIIACMVVSPSIAMADNDEPKFNVSMLKINEIYPAANSGFVEILNTSKYGIQFPPGWSVSNGPLPGAKHVIIPEGTILYAGKYMTIVPDPYQDTSNYDDAIHIIQGTAENGFLLSESTEVRLCYQNNNTLTIVDILGWGHAITSWGYYPDGSSNLFDNLTLTPGEANRVISLTEGAPSVRINEIQTKGSIFLEYDYIELYNFGESDVSLGGLSISDEQGTSQLLFPDTISLSSGEYAVIIPDAVEAENMPSITIIYNQSPDSTFGLGKSDTVNLYYNGVLMDSYSWEDGHHQSIGLIGEKDPQWVANLTPTPGSENRIR